MLCTILDSFGNRERSQDTCLHLAHVQSKTLWLGLEDTHSLTNVNSAIVCFSCSSAWPHLPMYTYSNLMETDELRAAWT